jgi:hypothetical protein
VTLPLALPDADTASLADSDTATDALAEPEPLADADASPEGHSVAPMLRTEAPSSDPHPASTNAAEQTTMSFDMPWIRDMGLLLGSRAHLVGDCSWHLG